MKQKDKIKKGCGLKESLGSSICKEGDLCDECLAKLKGYELGYMEGQKILHDYYFKAFKEPAIVEREDVDMEKFEKDKFTPGE